MREVSKTLATHENTEEVLLPQTMAQAFYRYPFV